MKSFAKQPAANGKSVHHVRLRTPTTLRDALLARWPDAARTKVVPSLRGLIVPVADLTPDPNNARVHPERNIEAVMESLAAFGQRKPIVVRAEGMVVMAGNGTLTAAKRLGWQGIAAAVSSMTDAEAAAYGIADNRTAELAEWDFETLQRLERLAAADGQAMPGFTLEDLVVLRAQQSPASPELKVTLADKFLIPPFSVLDARQGYWQDRKRAWIALGIQSELGRGAAATWGDAPSGMGTGAQSGTAYTETAKQRNGLLGFSEQARTHYRANAAPGGSPRPAATLGKDGKTVRGDGRGKPLAITLGSGAPGTPAAGFKAKTLGKMQLNVDGKTMQPDRNNRTTDDSCEDGTQVHAQSGTSIFDPVLCEIAYRWFTPPDGLVFDPFAGGSVRGIVAAKLGRDYVGIDLRPEQAAANVVQAEKITPANPPLWLVGNAKDTAQFAGNGDMPDAFDFVFSCPPYADLERYSDDPRDLSTMGYDEFLAAYREIITASCALLKPNRFACFVVGDVRDRRTGNYRGFVADTAAAFAAAGLALYNEAILVTAVGSLPIRVGRQFAGYRKLGKTHQQVLVFIKGDPAKAVKDCGPVEVCDLEEMFKDEIVSE